MNNKNVLENIIATEKNKLEKLISYQQYSDANDKQGYVDGLFQYYACDTDQTRKKNEDFAQWNLKGSVEEEQYGKASYWQSWLNGWEVAKNIAQ